MAIGPKVIATRWGLVRFKPVDLPPFLRVTIPPELDQTVTMRREGGEPVDLIVAMTGRLVAEESVMYDFAHEEPGQGMILPVLRIERLEYFWRP